ncbi:MAG: response regulator [Anaerolineales bacterium]|nr:MAG: response regulator [Anaerolineales bacterium]
MARILVIDDNTELLEMIRLLLEEQGGHEATLSADGAEGLAAALADPPDLAIVDVMMPRVTGYEICRQLRADSATANVPIIILTARGQPVDRDAALDAGANDYMVKPVEMEDLLARVASLLATGPPAAATAPAQEPPVAVQAPPPLPEPPAAAPEPVVTPPAAPETPSITIQVPISMVRTPSSAGGKATIALLSLRGGVGVTTLAVNLGATLAQRGISACVVDLCPSSGHVALQLGLRPQPSWSGLIKAGSADEASINSSLLRHDSGLHVLASPIFPVAGGGLPRAMAEEVLRILQRRFEVVIIDAPPVINGAALATFNTASTVGLVVEAEAPSIQTAVGTMRVLKHWAGKFQVILNQTVPGGGATAVAIERALKMPMLGSLPFDPAQARALASRLPLTLSDPASPLSEASLVVAQALLRAAETSAATG